MINFACLTPHPPLLIPKVGREQTNLIADTVKSMNILSDEIPQNTEIIVLISPHAPILTGKFAVSSNNKFIGDLREFGDNDDRLEFAPAQELLELILRISGFEMEEISNNGMNIIDHASFVPLFYLAKKIKIPPKLLILSYSFDNLQTHFEYGKALCGILENYPKKTALILSGDLSHRLSHNAPYGYHQNGPKFDKIIQKFLKDRDTASILNLTDDFTSDAAECGLKAICIGLGILDKIKWEFYKLSYEAPFGVGYLTGEFLLR